MFQPTNGRLSSLPSWPGWAWELVKRWETGKAHPLDRLWLDSTQIMTAAGMMPDPWQAPLLKNFARRVLLLCSRQAGKSTIAAALAVRTAILEAPATILIVSPTLRQSAELVQKSKAFFAALTGNREDAALRGAIGWDGAALIPVKDAAAEFKRKEAFFEALPKRVRESALQQHFSNGSRIIGLPGKEETIRGYSAVNLLLLDEASRIKDGVYSSVRPMLATSCGRLVAMTTPFGKRGWFYEEWESDRDWERVKVTAPECPRIAKSFLEEELQSLGLRWFRQEYMASFEAAVGQVFDPELIDRAMEGGVGIPPLFT